ncbi:MAG: hypothetical protein BGO11_15160 [Solirubrobacterales bacterium 70-9]|nr:MAG: hypothetical protein BGO11_15160 [Solirubrobacterales bacterium 70-9]
MLVPTTSLPLERMSSGTSDAGVVDDADDADELPVDAEVDDPEEDDDDDLMSPHAVRTLAATMHAVAITTSLMRRLNPAAGMLISSLSYPFGSG